MSWLKVGEREVARERLERARELAPEHEAAMRALERLDAGDRPARTNAVDTTRAREPG